jgi:CubicO group peptidase (beta-lactamase class C family)
MTEITAWHGRTLNEHIKLRDAAAKAGYRFLSLSLYGSVSSPLYAAVMILRPVLVAQHDWPLMTADEFQQTFDAQAKVGYGPVLIAATGSAGDPRFAAVFQPMNPIPLTRHLLGSGGSSDISTIQGMNAQALKLGLIPHSVAAYGDEENPRFAAIWFPDTNQTFWNADGVTESPATYQERFDQQTSVWCHPSVVTLNSANQYFSCFVDREIGPYVARHGMTPADYQTEFDKWTQQGFFPFMVQAAGSDAVSARFAAIFTQTEAVTPKQFHAVGPTANIAIDAVVQAGMQGSPVRQAALAIVQGKRLVYARGYTYAEADWPLAQPTTYFRLASVSKTVTALAVFQLIEEGKLHLSDTLQSHLQLTTPAGEQPSAQFSQITIQQLLEHKSGVNADDFRNGPAVRQAFANAGHAINLPVTQAQTDSYIASLLLDAPPGTTQNYNNCGYYLLGRVVAKLRGTSQPMTAYQQHLCMPLGITRFRSATSLVTTAQPGEARYQEPTHALAPSQMSDAQPLVPIEYGTEQIELMQGGGGLSAAASDLARLVAAVIDPNDSPMMKRTTLNGMLKSGAALTAPNALDAITRIVNGAAAELKRRFRLPVVLIWVDTLIAAAQYAKAGDDNDAAITQKVMSVLNGLSQRTEALVVGIDHFGKVVDTGTRGSSSKEGHAGTVLALLADRDISGSLTNTRLAVRKQRDGACGLEIPFTPRTVQVGTDPDGDPITRVIIDWQKDPIKPADAEWSKSLRLLRQVLMVALSRSAKTSWAAASRSQSRNASSRTSMSPMANRSRSSTARSKIGR